MKTLLTATVLVSLNCLPASAQSELPALHGESGGSVPVRMVITAEPLRGSQAPVVSAADVTVLQDHVRGPVTELLPLRGDNAGMEFYIFIDERVDPNQAALFEQLRRFVSRQAPSTAVGVAYMFNSEARIVQALTKDHARAAQALRASSGSESAAANPYLSLSALMNGWHTGEALRREALIITDGMDRFEDIGDYNMNVEDAIADAQRTGVLVYSLYAPALGHASHSPALIHWGQTYLGQLAEETGGEAYLPSPGTPAPLESYFADLAKHLVNQYRVTFLAMPNSGDGFQRVRLEAGGQDVELVSAHRFYLPGQQAHP